MANPTVDPKNTNKIPKRAISGGSVGGSRISPGPNKALDEQYEKMRAAFDLVQTQRHKLYTLRDLARAIMLEILGSPKVDVYCYGDPLRHGKCDSHPSVGAYLAQASLRLAEEFHEALEAHIVPKNDALQQELDTLENAAKWQPAAAPWPYNESQGAQEEGSTRSPEVQTAPEGGGDAPTPTAAPEGGGSAPTAQTAA